MSTTTTTPSSDIRAIVLEKLALLNVNRTALREALAPFQTRIAEFELACTMATAEAASEIERLEAELKTLALANPLGIFGEDSKSIMQGPLMLAVRTTDKVIVAGDEEDVIATLKKAAKSHPDPATRIAAEACLREKTTLNKEFIRDKWEAFEAWFTVFGLAVEESNSASVVEKKPAKPREPKPLKAPKKKKGNAGDPLELEERAA